MRPRARAAPAQRTQERASPASWLPAHPAGRGAAQQRATALSRPCLFFRPVGRRGADFSRASLRLGAARTIDGWSARALTRGIR